MSMARSIFTRHTLVWQGTKFAVSGYRYLSDGGTDRREILYDGKRTYRSQTASPLLGAVPQGIPKSKFCQAPYMVNIVSC